MSTIEKDTPVVALPTLVDGERLDRETFHERYAAMPEETRAELIGGIVSMASPLGGVHGFADSVAHFWLTYYASFTPGTHGFINASVFLGDYGEHQPDSVLRIFPEFGGRTWSVGDYYAGGPELVVEVSVSSLAKDLGPRLEDYERAGVPEYLVVSADPLSVYYHVLREGRLVVVRPDADGLYRSKVFPGLWLDPVALLARDYRRLREVVERGLATAEHADFVARLARAAGGAGGG